MGIQTTQQPTLLLYIREVDMLDNYAATRFWDGGVDCLTLEHGYQAAKFADPDIRDRILSADSPWEAKEIAHAHKHLQLWGWGEHTKLETMRRLKRAKLNAHPVIAKVLLDHCGHIIIDNSPHPFWGVGPDGKGLNWDGKLWMEIQEELCRS